MGLMYPVLNIQSVIEYAQKLYPFMEAAHRTGLMQQGMPGSDALDDADTSILKLVIATALTTEGTGASELGKRIFTQVQPAVDKCLLGHAGIKGIQILAMAVGCEPSLSCIYLADSTRPCTSSIETEKVRPGV